MLTFSSFKTSSSDLSYASFIDDNVGFIDFTFENEQKLVIKFLKKSSVNSFIGGIGGVIPFGNIGSIGMQ